MISVHGQFRRGQDGLFYGVGSYPGHSPDCPCPKCGTIRAANVLPLLGRALGMGAAEPVTEISYSNPKPDRAGRLAVGMFSRRRRPARA